LYELLFKGLLRTTAQEAQRKANAGRTDGRRAQAAMSRTWMKLWVRSPDGGVKPNRVIP